LKKVSEMMNALPSVEESTRTEHIHVKDGKHIIHAMLEYYRYIPEDVDVRRGGIRAVGEPVREIQPSVRRSPSYVPCPNEHPEEQTKKKKDMKQLQPLTIYSFIHLSLYGTPNNRGLSI
jgi:hypothetical protein